MAGGEDKNLKEKSLHIRVCMSIYTHTHISLEYYNILVLAMVYCNIVEAEVEAFSSSHHRIYCKLYSMWPAAVNNNF